MIIRMVSARVVKCYISVVWFKHKTKFICVYVCVYICKSNFIFLWQKDDVKFPFVYMCATMWHEEEHEMLQLLKSVLRYAIFVVTVNCSHWLSKILLGQINYYFTERL